MILKEKPMSVTEICEKLNEEQSKVSHNLKKLTECRVLSVEQAGKNRIYSLNKKTILPILELVGKHVKVNCPHCNKI
jgi:DNA-binding transcriptional ArsR family regulator